MIRVRGVKVKRFVLNGCFDRLYGTKSPPNGFHKLLDSKLFGMSYDDKSHKSSYPNSSSATALKRFLSPRTLACKKRQGLSLPHMPILPLRWKVAEGGGVEPRGFTHPWFSGPVANRLAAPSWAEEAGIERVLPRLRISNPVPFRSAILPVPKGGFEPPTSSPSGWHVCQLRHLGINWSRRVDSNHH